jgi:hypothetical protein
MSDWPLLFWNALIYGIGLSLVITTIIVVSGIIEPDMWVGKYPPDIQHKYGPMSRGAARLRPLVAGFFFVFVLVIPILGLLTLRPKVGPIPFIPAVGFSLVALLVFNTFDLIVLDWLLFCTVQPRMMVLPGTEGMAAYREYRFHFVGFVKGLGFCAVGSVLIAALWLVIQGMTT